MNANVSVKDIDLLVSIVRALPPERVAELIDFARFLEAQELARELQQAGVLDETEEDAARWDNLLLSEKGQRVLEKLATDALEEYRAGKTTVMGFTPEGRIQPE